MYVRTEGGGGFKNRPLLRTNSTGNVDKGGGGSKIPKIVQTYFIEAPNQNHRFGKRLSRLNARLNVFFCFK